MTTRKKPKRGGARVGAGRKIGPYGTAGVVPYRLPISLLALVAERAQAEGKPPSEVHAALLAKVLGVENA